MILSYIYWYKILINKEPLWCIIFTFFHDILAFMGFVILLFSLFCYFYYINCVRILNCFSFYNHLKILNLLILQLLTKKNIYAMIFNNLDFYWFFVICFKFLQALSTHLFDNFCDNNTGNFCLHSFLTQKFFLL